MVAINFCNERDCEVGKRMRRMERINTMDEVEKAVRLCMAVFGQVYRDLKFAAQIYSWERIRAISLRVSS